MSLRRRLTLVAAGAVAVTVVGLALVAYLLVANMLRDQVDESLRAAAVVTDNRLLRQAPLVPPPSRQPQRIRVPGPFIGVRIVDAQGGTTRQFGGEAPFPTPPEALTIARAPSGTTRLIDGRNDDGRPVRVLLASLGDGRAAIIARDTNEVETLLARLRWVFAGLGVIGVVAAGFLGRGVAGAATRPLLRLRNAVDHVGRTGDLTRRVPENGPGELRDVAVRFNRMLGRLQASTEALDASARAQRQLVADASHELRTPIAALRTNVEVLQGTLDLSEADRARMLGDVERQLHELGMLVGDIIDLARGDTPLPELQDVRLDELVASEVAAARRRAGGVRFVVEAEPAVVDADPERLGRAVRNLLDNAVKFSPPDGVVEVRVRDGVIAVRDHGRGIDPASVPHVFDRFWRAPEARDVPGSGLGLAIVRQAVEAHGGTVTVVGRAPGGGACFEVALPGVTAPAEPPPVS